MRPDPPGLPFSSLAVQRCAARVLAQIGTDPRYLTLLADLTTLRERCRFGLGAEGALAARYLDLPFVAVSFYGQGAGLREALSGVLSGDERCSALVPEAQRTQLEGVAHVLNLALEWQMPYVGDPATLDPGEAVPLSAFDLPAVKDLVERTVIHAFDSAALEMGPYYGVWREGRLVSMAGTRLMLAAIGEIGNVVTDSDYRRRGLASMSVAATTRALLETGRRVLLHVYHSTVGAVTLYEQLGYRRERTMYLVHFHL
jgi:ribosomal protein S18 acetylase RimI-like enzyme